MNLTWLMCLWIVQGLITAYIAHKKGRNPYLWFPIGCFFGIFGIFAIIFVKPAKTPEAAKERRPVSAFRLPHFLWYYLDDQSKQYGPMSSNALIAAFREGKLSLATYVWREGMPEWKHLSKVCEELGVPTDSLATS